MTSPSLGPGNVPANVMQAGQLGAMLQHLNPAKVNTHSTGQYPGVMSGTNAGLPGGVMQVITGVFSQFIGQIAEDGGTLPTDPGELEDLAVDFFEGLPVVSFLVEIIKALLGLFDGGDIDFGGLNPLQFLSILMGQRWDQVDDLQDKTQKLEGVIGYACRYMSTSPGTTTNPTIMPFDTQVGPAVGVTLQSGGKYRLDSKGLWRADAQCRFTGGFLCPPQVFMDVVVRDPGGSEFARRKAMASTSDPVTLTNLFSFVVPASGYTVEVQAWTSSLPALGNWRGLSGGLQTTGFNLTKISSETS